MKEPTMEEVLELVSFKRHSLDGSLVIKDVFGYVTGSVIGNVCGDVEGNVWGNVLGYVSGSVEGSVGGSVGRNVCGSVEGSVGGSVGGTINARKWRYVETPKEKAIRLIEEGRGEEAIQALQEGE